jgi:O-antigen ligase
MVLVRWVLAGGTVCCLVAVIQFITHTNPADWIKPILLGFTDNNSGIAFQGRGSLMRVAGTTMHPIELGVVSAMLLPLSIWRALYDRQGWKRLQWAVVGLFILTNAMTVSRSALIGIAIALVITVPFLPPIAKRWSVVLVPLGAAGLFVGVPGLIGTLFNASTAGSSDSSITYRTEDYPLVLRLVADRPWFGSGPGTWIPIKAIDVFDNEYLLVAVTMGVVGLIGLVAYLLVPALAALGAAKGAQDRELGLLAAASAAAGFIATVASGTFDSLSFQVFAMLVPFFIGLSGASWLMVKNQLDPHRTEPSRVSAGEVPGG